MRTTDGRSAFAAAENADDSTRASLGASVLGVTVPPGCSAGGAVGAEGASLLAGAGGAGACSPPFFERRALSWSQPALPASAASATAPTAKRTLRVPVCMGRYFNHQR